MASPYLPKTAIIQIRAQLTLRNGPKVLNKYIWTFISRGVTHGRQQAHDGSNPALIVLHQATNGVHWVIHHVTGVPVSEQQELVTLQQQTRDTALVFTAHPQIHGFP